MIVKNKIELDYIVENLYEVIKLELNQHLIKPL